MKESLDRDLCFRKPVGSPLTGCGEVTLKGWPEPDLGDCFGALASEPVPVPQGSGDSAVLTRWGVILGLVFSLFILALAWPVLSSGALLHGEKGFHEWEWQQAQKGFAELDKEQAAWEQKYGNPLPRGGHFTLADHTGAKWSCTWRGCLDTDYQLPKHPLSGDTYLINNVFYIASYSTGWAAGALPLWIDP
jgi:hypothetical protein